MFSKLFHHADLVKAMSSRAGLDLGEEIEQGHLSAGQFRGAVVTCARCRYTAECEKLLSTPAGTAASASVPDYCLNKGMLARLQNAHE
jgi:hypothetical protein